MGKPALVATAAETEPLSQLHADLGMIERQTDAHNLNRVANDPSVYPWVKGHAVGRLDLSPIVANPANVLLMGEHGGVLFAQHQPGYYEAHTQVMPAGRGAWTLRMVRAALHWMFTRTDAIEIVTKVPQGNAAALGLVRAIHGVYEFTSPHGWVYQNDPVPAAVYALRLQDWVKRAPGLVERGAWFHHKLEAELTQLGKTEDVHEDDPTHDRYVGAACEMMMGGQPQKAAIFYNRWAVMAGYAPIQLMSISPLTVNIRSAIICVRGDDFWVMTCP